MVDLQEIEFLMRKSSKNPRAQGGVGKLFNIQPTKMGMVALKFFATAALLWFFFHKAKLGPIVSRFAEIKFGWAIVGLALLQIQLLLTGIRWFYVSQIVGARIGVGIATRLILVGQFFNQILPSSVGGDGVRAWLLSREGISIRHSLVSVICDRGSALILLSVIAACTLPAVLLICNITVPYAWSLTIMIDTITMAGLLYMFFCGEFTSRWLIGTRVARPLGVVIRDLRLVLFSSAVSIRVVELTVVVQAIVVGSVYFLARALGINFGVGPVLMLPLIMLIASIPISFAGWGAREGAMVAGLGFAGIPPADALAVSVSIGIAQIIVGLPGLVVILMSSYGRKRASQE
jgi:uncharacterized protein (TIRG00374 family)